mmetsp:Transcript_32974/g.49809  ORF Transcript_32974/g.49809 Transcript_32974/m.49809 type:complete len:135 (-) Transcript_32974:26-430(-)
MAMLLSSLSLSSILLLFLKWMQYQRVVVLTKYDCIDNSPAFRCYCCCCCVAIYYSTTQGERENDPKRSRVCVKKRKSALVVVFLFVCYTSILTSKEQKLPFNSIDGWMDEGSNEKRKKKKETSKKGNDVILIND